MSQVIHGPRSDEDLANATVTLYVPYHSTTQTSYITRQVTLTQLAILLREVNPTTEDSDEVVR